MNVLPNSKIEFTKKDYWDSFFVKRGTNSFEWYGEYDELSGVLEKYLKPSDAVLVVGCGNSNLSVQLFDAGYNDLMNIDISNVAIKQMQKKCKKKPGLIFKQMDVKNMEFEDSKFNVVLDKGTLDALMPDSSNKTKQSVSEMFKEIDRVLKIGGRYICISLLQKHILEYVLEYFSSSGWIIRICRCHDVEPVGHSLPVFIIVFTKLKKFPDFKPVYEIILNTETVQRIKTQNEMIEAVSKSQQAALICSGLARKNISDLGEVDIDLSLPDNPIPRYTIVVTDKKCRKSPESMKYAAFIVPCGREREWLFGTKEGRAMLRESSGMERLAVVLLHRGHKYSDLQQVQNEVQDAIRSMAPADLLSKKQKIPFLSVGADLGNRQEIVQGNSKMSGDYIVEDAEGDGGTIFRRLIFLENQNVVQSEARIIKDPLNGNKIAVDTSYLSCDHHVFMTVGVCMALMNNKSSDVRILVIGLGGGGLCMFIRKYFPKVFITVVDIDPEVKNIAVNYFGLKEDDHLNVVISDGIDFINCTDQNFDAILIDVDSKDSSKGLSCPPEIFLEPEFIANVLEHLSDKGIFILNFVCRINKLRQEMWQLLGKNFSNISSIKLKDEVNEIIFLQDEKHKIEIDKACNYFNKSLSRNDHKSENLVDMEQLSDMVRLN